MNKKKLEGKFRNNFTTYIYSPVHNYVLSLYSVLGRWFCFGDLDSLKFIEGVRPPAFSRISVLFR